MKIRNWLEHFKLNAQYTFIDVSSKDTGFLMFLYYKSPIQRRMWLLRIKTTELDGYLPVNMISTRMKNITIYETMIWDETSGTEIAN